MKMKALLFMLFTSCAFLTANGQELFFDRLSQDTCLFIGGISPDDGKALKVIANGNITYRDPEDLIQVGLLIGNEFTDELFRQGVHFELSGYEPHWKASISRKENNEQ